MFRTTIWAAFSTLALLAACCVFSFAIAAGKVVSELTDEELVNAMFDAKRADRNVEANQLRVHELETEFERRLNPPVWNQGLEELWETTRTRRLLTDPVLPPMTPAELWPILMEVDDVKRLIEAVRQSKERYDAATPSERAALEQGFIDYAMGLPLPADWRDNSDESIMQRTDYSLFVSRSAEIFPETVALDLCKALFLDRQLPNGMDDYAYILSMWRGPHGVEFAAEIGRFYESLGADYPREILSDKAGAAQSVINALRGCGDAGLDELERLGLVNKYWVVGGIGTARARALLLNAYEQRDRNVPRAALVIFSGLCAKLYAQDEEIKALVRQDLPQYLVVSETDFSISDLSYAIGLVASLRDPYFLPMLRDLQTQVKEKGVAHCEESKSLPSDSVAYGADVLMRDLDETTAELEKIEAKAKAASTP